MLLVVVAVDVVVVEVVVVVILSTHFPFALQVWLLGQPVVLQSAVVVVVVVCSTQIPRLQT